MALRVTLVSIRAGGSTSAGYDAAVDDYLKRCGNFMPGSARVFRTETQFLKWSAVEQHAGAFLLWIADPGGVSLTSGQFAQRLETERDRGTRHLALAIGPADGWSEEARGAAALRMSLGAMTLPHELARLVVAEQLYRATTILQGHPYHLGH